MIRCFLFLTLTALLASCHTSVRCNLGAPRWVKPTRAERTACAVPGERRAKFDLVGSYNRGSKGFRDIEGIIQEGDVIAYRMTGRERRSELLHGNVKSVSYMLMKYAHLSMVVRDPENADGLRLYTSQGVRGPNVIDGLDVLEHHTFDVYRIDRWRQLDMVRLREFVDTSLKKANRIFGYNFIGVVGIWSNYLEPHTQRDIGDDYLCSTAVAAALHYAGMDLDAVRCCEALNMISPERVVTSTGRMMSPAEIKERKGKAVSCLAH